MVITSTYREACRHHFHPTAGVGEHPVRARQAAHDLGGDPRSAARGDSHRRTAAWQPRAGRATAVRTVRGRSHLGSRGHPRAHSVGLPRASRQSSGGRRTDARDPPHRRLGDTRPAQGAGSATVRGAAHDRADDVRARSSPGDHRRACRHRRAWQHDRPTELDEFRTIDRAFHTAIARACGNPLLQEVYGKTLGALFDSGELASLLYAEINRRKSATSSPRPPQRIEPSPRRSSPDAAKPRSALCKPTSTTWSDA